MREYKILFTGSMGAGKTTAIGAVSDEPPIVTDVFNNDLSNAKTHTTVGLDFGQFSLDNGDRVRMFGTPGQERFDFLWKILAKNAIGMIILADNSRPDPLADLRIYLEAFADDLDIMPCTIGIGRLEEHPTPSVDDYIDELTRHDRILPVLEVDVRNRQDVLMLIDTLLAQLEAGMLGE